MAWVELIDGLSERYPQEQFKVPFTAWAGIFRNIEERFIIKKWSQEKYRNWLGNVKKEVLIKTILCQEIENEINKLDTNTNFWLVIVYGDSDRSTQYVFDCHVKPMQELIRWAPADFFIVEKRYKWLTYFKVNKNTNEVSISKSGDGQTPFDSE